MKAKPLALLLSAMIVMCSAAFGSIAYLTSTDTNVNTFTVGKVNMTLTEADVTPEGEIIEGAERVKANEYRLIPGTTYVKDPTVTIIKGSEDAYVRLLVTINKISELHAIFGAGFLPETFVEGWDSAIWPCVTTTPGTDNTATYEFRYRSGESKTVNALNTADDVVLAPLFTKFTYPGTITSEQNDTLTDLKITIVGQAIQAKGFVDTIENESVSKTAEDNAWEAFGVQHPAETTALTEDSEPNSDSPAEENTEENTEKPAP